MAVLVVTLSDLSEEGAFRIPSKVHLVARLIAEVASRKLV
jgi:hypothetical protein